MSLKKQLIILKIRVLTTLILTISSQLIYAQVFGGGQNPPSVKFEQINTPNFQIIFPSYQNREAQQVANVLEKAVDDVSFSLGQKPQPISIILQGHTTQSNGFVQLAPRRSEFYTMPPQEFDTQDWLNSLAIHELRHVVQFDKLAPNLKSPFFEQLKLALFGINLPAWFFEGDAVVTETLLTPGGRGRQPSFDMVLRANLLSNKHYTYSKSYLGSYRDFTPDYYTLGYFMTGKMRRDFGAHILDTVLNRIANVPIRPYNFSSSLKKFSSYTTAKLYDKTMEELRDLWGNRSNHLEWKNYEALNQINPKTPSDYLLPYLTEEGQILALKSSKSETNKVIIFDNKTEKKVIDVGIQTEPNLHYANGKLTWDEIRYDKRYSKQDFSVICIYDLKTGKARQLTRRSRNFSPALSPDAKKIVSVKVDLENKFNLEEIDIETGKPVKIYANTGGYTLQTPNYSPDGKKIVVTGVSQKGKTLLIFDTETGKSQSLFEEERQLISRPIFWKDGIIYKAHYEGIDNIYYFDIPTKKRYRISDSKFGAFNPSISVKTHKLYFNDYQHHGHNVVSLNLKSVDQLSTIKTTNNSLHYFEPLKTQENTTNTLEDIPSKIYPTKPYREISNLFYFHSISPVVSNGSNDSKIGLNLLSDNKLNTLSTSIGYSYNTSLKTSEFNANMSYKKYYPIISASYSDRGQLSYARLNIPDTLPTIIPFQWREAKTSFTVNVPFFANWYNKSIRTGLEIQTNYIHRYNISIPVNGFISTIKFPMEYLYYWTFATNRSQRDLAPRFGADLRLSYRHIPFDQVDGTLFYFKTSFYLPGLFSNHSLQASLNWQNTAGIFLYNIEIPRARGYANLSPLGNIKNTFLFDYKFPLAYPDWQIGSLAYIKRLRSGVFSDFENKTWRSYGISFSADMNLLRYYLPNFSLGTKIIMPAEKNQTKKPIFEIGLTYDY